MRDVEAGVAGSPTSDLVTIGDPGSASAEAIRGFQVQLERRCITEGARSFALIGDAPKRGVSFLAANLAVVFAQSGVRTALVDANFAAPRQASIFRVDPSVPGLSDWLHAATTGNGHARYGADPMHNLTLLPAGRMASLALLADRHLNAVMVEMTRLFDVVIYDTPSMMHQAGAMMLAANVDRTVLVGREHKTKAAALKTMESLVIECHGHVAGVILSKF